jgi:hypothetical protein
MSVWLWRADAKGVQGPGGVAGVVAAGGCDAGVPGELEDPDGQVPQGCHDLGSVAGADLGGVLAVADVADVVQDFDLPVAAHLGGELARRGLVGAQAGDGVDRDGAPFDLAGQGPDLAGEADGLGGVREGQPGGDGRGLQGPALLAAMPAVVLADSGRDLPPGRFLIWACKVGWFFFTTRM